MLETIGIVAGLPELAAFRSVHTADAGALGQLAVVASVMVTAVPTVPRCSCAAYWVTTELFGVNASAALPLVAPLTVKLNVGDCEPGRAALANTTTGSAAFVSVQVSVPLALLAGTVTVPP